MNRNSAALMLSTSLLTGSVLAGTMGSVTQQPDWTWVGTFSAGPAWEGGDKTHTFYLASDIENLQGQLGLAVAAASNASLSGMIWDDADPQFANYIYNYTIQHTHVAVKGKLLADARAIVLYANGVLFNLTYLA